jgi:putative cardiolipin synthase
MMRARSQHPASRVVVCALILFAGFGLAACGTLPAQVDRPLSAALPPSADSPLSRIARQSTPDPALSGVRLMPLGLYALDARIELIRRARYSLDVQYYLIQDDRSGRLFMRSLRDAALRGVRVRLLIDDLYTAGADPMFEGLAAFPNVEVRLFNPFCCARQSVTSRFAASLGDWKRLNHRMHNKLFIADGAIAVMGGRNIADEYFARATASNFVDMDVLLIGNVVHQLVDIFDVYWNSPQAYAIATILGETTDQGAMRDRFNRLVDEGDQMTAIDVPPMDMLGRRPLSEDFDSGHLRVDWGRAMAFADQPGKVMATTAEKARAMSVQMNIMDRVALSTRRVAISSPYFVPGAAGVQAFTDLAQRGVAVVILTNSLAANDVPIVHVGYARYRTGLVRAGVELYELSPGGLQRDSWDVLPGLSHGRLHAKAAVIDDSMVYIGSMNLDPRSESTNTELGIFVQCPELARDVMRVLDVARQRSSYRLRFGPDGESLQWQVMGGAQDVTFSSEPEASLMMQLRNKLLEPFVPEQLL